MSIKQTRRAMYWFVSLVSISSLCIFTATFFAYSNAHATHRDIGFMPATFGLLFFFVSMTGLSYLSLPGPRDWLQLCTAIGIALLEGAVAAALFLFLIFNTFGS